MRRKQRKDHRGNKRQSASPGGASTSGSRAVDAGPERKNHAASSSGPAGPPQPLAQVRWSLGLACGVLAAVALWAYWPSLVELVATWNREPDYSHGYFVVPLAAYFLWHRRSGFPGIAGRLSWGGLLLICFSVAVNVAGALWYMEPLHAWSIPFWIAGACWFFGGWRLLRWSLPAIVFLGFMIPLPYGVEKLLTVPLQRTATQLSCWLLQSLGQPAVAEGNVILIRDARLSVAEACSGLRIFVSIIALAFAFSVLTQKPWWMKASLFLAVLPVTLVANSVRIAATAFLQVYVSDEAAHRFTHDVAGWLMIVFAAALLGAMLWYVSRLFFQVETVSTRELLAHEGAAPSG